MSILISGGELIVRANGLPDHATGQFPGRGNPHRISAQNHDFHIPLNPQVANRPTPAKGSWFGVAVNGVPFEPGTAEFWKGNPSWNYEAKSGFIDLGLDGSNAHVQPNGSYHYHGLPLGLMERLGGEGTRMLLVGYAADGFPIYTSYGHSVATNAASPLKRLRSSWRVKPGERPGGPGGQHDGRFTADYEFVLGHGDLDECNGRFGVTPNYPRGIYYYCITEEFPHLSRFWRGTPDPSFRKRGPAPANRRPRLPGWNHNERPSGAPDRS